MLIKYYSNDMFWDFAWSQCNWCLIYWCCTMFKLMDLSWTHLFITRVLQTWLWLGEYELIRFELYKSLCTYWNIILWYWMFNTLFYQIVVFNRHVRELFQLRRKCALWSIQPQTYIIREYMDNCYMQCNAMIVHNYAPYGKSHLRYLSSFDSHFTKS
jgi:hypothetical protein